MEFPHLDLRDNLNQFGSGWLACHNPLTSTIHWWSVLGFRKNKIKLFFFIGLYRILALLPAAQIKTMYLCTTPNFLAVIAEILICEKYCPQVRSGSRSPWRELTNRWHTFGEGIPPCLTLAFNTHDADHFDPEGPHFAAPFSELLLHS